MCSSNCPTPGAHASWGECIRAKSLRLGDVKGQGRTRSHDSRLANYDSARRAGIQPATTRPKDVDFAVRVSNETGVAFDANAA
jgi:hypothetical protein